MKLCLMFRLTSRYLEYYPISGILDIRIQKQTDPGSRIVRPPADFHALSLITTKLRKFSVFKVVHF